MRAGDFVAIRKKKSHRRPLGSQAGAWKKRLRADGSTSTPVKINQVSGGKREKLQKHRMVFETGTKGNGACYLASKYSWFMTARV